MIRHFYPYIAQSGRIAKRPHFAASEPHRTRRLGAASDPPPRSRIGPAASEPPRSRPKRQDLPGSAAWYGTFMGGQLSGTRSISPLPHRLSIGRLRIHVITGTSLASKITRDDVHLLDLLHTHCGVDHVAVACGSSDLRDEKMTLGRWIWVRRPRKSNRSLWR
jgi:hypothetical protein